MPAQWFRREQERRYQQALFGVWTEEERQRHYGSVREAAEQRAEFIRQQVDAGRRRREEEEISLRRLAAEFQFNLSAPSKKKSAYDDEDW